MPNLSEHLSSAETTEQLSARFAYAAAMKSMNNLLLLGDGESWSRQSVDFAGLPEMARTFLQVAAGAADIPVTRLLGQSPSGLSATGESDVRNYYDMIAARQELDLRPQLERLDRLICWSEDIDEGALTFAFRPLWQLDEPAKAALALSRAQATQIYAGLKLWPAEVMAKLVEAQLVTDATYPNAAAVFAEGGTTEVAAQGTADAFQAGLGALHYLTEPRNRTDPGEKGRWIEGEDDPGGSLTLAGFHHERERRRRRAKRLKRQARKRELEERRRPELAEERGGSEEPDPRLAEKPRSPPAGEPEKPPSQPLMPHSSLPDTERDDFELPSGVTPQEAKELHLNGSPVGISFEVRGNNTTELGDSYSDAVNAYSGTQKAPRAPELGGSEPDGVLVSRDSGERFCVEAKFFEDWSKSLYNPDLRRVFPHGQVQKTIDQALKYDDHCPEGVEWYTNSLDFVKAYSPKFKKAGVKNFTFTIIPAVRVKP